MAEPVRVGELLGGFPGMGDRLAAARLLAAWPEVAGPAAPRSRAERLENGTLVVAVDSSGWLHRLTLEAETLLGRCRRLVPAAEVRAIRFHFAPVGASEGESVR